MKKFLFMIALMVGVVSANAQIATQNSNALDNIGVGVTAGVTTPLDFNSMFPINTTFGVVATKAITPVLGAQLEATTSLGDNHFADVKTAFKALNVGLNGSVNLPNLFLGYNGTPRAFETSAIVGLGIRHAFDNGGNNIALKTGFDFAFNIGKKKAHSLVFTPAVYWGLRNGNHIQFNHNNALISLMATYIYHFKNSNGTHSFKTWDIGAMNDEINYLKGALDECQRTQPVVVEKPLIVEKKTETVINNTVTVGEWTVEFEQGKSELSETAIGILDSIGQDIIVDVIGTASPEGTPEFNQRISEERAAKVADYLTKRGVKVNSWKGIGVQLNRLAIVKTLK